MGSTSSKILSESSTFQNLVKNSIVGSQRSGGSIPRAYPKRGGSSSTSSSNNNDNNGNNNEPHLPSSFSSSRSHEPRTANTNIRRTNELASMDQNLAAQSGAKNDDNLMDVSLHKRLQQIGPVQRQDMLSHNYAIPSLSRGDSGITRDDTSPYLNPTQSSSPSSSSSSPILSPILSQVVRNPDFIKSNIAVSSPSLSSEKPEEVRASFNPDLGGSISSMTSPITSSNKTNAAITILTARSIFAAEAEAEFTNLGKSGYKGRRYLDLDIVRQILVMRDAKDGLDSEEIERRLGLKAGVVKLLGKRGVVGVIE